MLLEKMRRLDRFRISGLGAVLLVLFVTVYGPGCESDREGSQPRSSKVGGVLYFGVETGFAGFDVLETVSGGVLLPSMATLVNLVMEPLFRRDSNGELIAVLGLSATPSKAHDSWNFMTELHSMQMLWSITGPEC
mgnify:CR=1 FL=1